MRSRIFLIAATLLFVSAVSNAQTAPSGNKTSSQTGSKNAAFAFDGAWRSDDNKGFSVMHNGYFNSVGQDSTGNWNSVHAGTYTVNNDNTITFKVLYSSFADHIGASNTAEYTVSGETVHLRHFKKLLDAQGKDITDQMPKDAHETMVRLK